jgi:hypothetical protein
MPKIVIPCQRCSSSTGISWNGFCPSCIDDACANGDGESVGLPAVPEHEYDATILAVHVHDLEHPSYDQANCMMCSLVTDVCDECDISEEMMDPEDDEAHLIVDGIILIGCEGYHEPSFRYIYWSEVV